MVFYMVFVYRLYLTMAPASRVTLPRGHRFGVSRDDAHSVAPPLAPGGRRRDARPSQLASTAGQIVGMDLKAGIGCISTPRHRLDHW